MSGRRSAIVVEKRHSAATPTELWAGLELPDANRAEQKPGPVAFGGRPASLVRSAEDRENHRGHAGKPPPRRQHDGGVLIP